MAQSFGAHVGARLCDPDPDKYVNGTCKNLTSLQFARATCTAYPLSVRGLPFSVDHFVYLITACLGTPGQSRYLWEACLTFP